MTTPNQPLHRQQFSRRAGVSVPRPVAGVESVIDQPVTPVSWFRRMPTGGTVYVKPAESTQS
ncbi:hypothetical protein SAMN05216188_12288 [Lentzea xinjiangensis]|uniref:Uncharacterized protein n=1 Tax=Lentzea xinjiangensis TaxID=402600 RepID=A0A1H9US06_9PSEU|nr:hypothetical protein SAMN05216188_12288 [Lentzea xinjiangensis]